MNARVDHLLHEALELPEGERSALVVALIDSLEGSADAAVAEAWRQEILQRREAFRAGRLHAAPWAEVKSRLADL